MSTTVNDFLLLISGASATGKSASLMNLKNPEGVIYLGTEAGKKLPFKSKFKEFVISDPLQILEGFDYAESQNDIHTIVIDSLTFLLDQYESQYVLKSANGMQAWNDFQQYFKNLMQKRVATSSKNVIFTAHTLTIYNETDMVMETKIPVKGALKNNGLESYFSINIMTVKKTIKDLEPYKSDMLNITPEEEALGFKYCFQTKLTKETINTRIRSPLGMFTTEQTFIDNDTQMVLDHLHNYYK